MLKTTVGATAWLTAVLLSGSALGAEVTVYGASWCGPCKSLQRTLKTSRVPFQYVDIDTESGRTAYNSARGNLRGIPLTVVGRDKVVGADFGLIQKMLTKASIRAEALKVKPGQKTWGGQTAAWWKQHFSDLRAQQQSMKTQVKELEKVAVDHHEKEVLRTKAENLEILDASLQALWNDAARAGVPLEHR